MQKPTPHELILDSQARIAELEKRVDAIEALIPDEVRNPKTEAEKGQETGLVT